MIAQDVLSSLPIRSGFVARDIPPRRHALDRFARNLAAYLPVTLVRRMLDGGSITPGVADSFPAAALFIDLSGFTAIAEAVAQDGPAGAELLNRVMLTVFTPMIAAIHRAGGAVSHFYGDALLVYFPDERGDALTCALACAGRLQQLMAGPLARVRVRRPDFSSSEFALTAKVGVGYGPVVALVVGDGDGMEFVLGGPAVDEATSAEKHATAGQIIIAPSACRRRGGAGDVYCVADALPAWETCPPAPAAVDWTALGDAALTRFIALARPFVPPAIVTQLDSAAEPVALFGDHRPVTSMFVQFDGIDFADPACGERLQAYYLWARRVVHRYAPENGRINRILTGDKGNQLHILLGAPVAPDAPEQAFYCALALQRERPAWVGAQAIGISAGGVFACRLGSAERHEYTVMGTRVVLSARLCTHAAGDGLFTDRATAARAHRHIEFEALPPVTLKGFREPVPLVRPLRPRAGTAQLEMRYRRFRRRLVGRDTAEARLTAQLEQALADRASCTLISGEAGVGKSHLIAVGVRHWLSLGGTGYVAVAQPHSAETPYDLWLEIWRETFGIRLTDSPAQQAQTLREALAGLGLTDSADAALWGDFLGLPVPMPEALAALPARGRRERFFALVVASLRALALRQPFLLILEDVHWSDQPTLDLLNYVVERLVDVPLVIVVSTRSVSTTALPWLAAVERPAAHIALANLPAHHARALVRRLVNTTRLPEPLLDYLHLRDGAADVRPINPFLLEEAIGNLLETGALVRRAGQLHVDSTRLAAQPLPDSVNSLLLARLDRLADDERRVLQTAAVIGDQFFLATLAAVCADLAPERVERAVDHLAHIDVLERLSVEPGPVYTFTSALTRDVAYGNLPFAYRQRLHATVADYVARRYARNLRPYHTLLARHYSRAGRHTEAFHFALLAGDAAYGVFANREAAEFYNLASRHSARSGLADAAWTQVCDMHLRWGHALMLVGEFGPATASVERALALAAERGDEVRSAESYLRLAEFHARNGLYRDVADLADRVISMGDAVQPQQQVKARTWAGRAAGYLGDYDTAERQLAAAEALCSALDDRRQLVSVLDATAYLAFLRNQLDKAAAVMARSINLSYAFSSPFSIATNLNNLAQVQMKAGQWDSALRALDEALQLSADASAKHYAGILGHKAGILAVLGDDAAARELFEEAEYRLQAMDDRYALRELYLLWGLEFACLRGEWLLALDRLALAAELIHDFDHEDRVRLLLARALAYGGIGRLASAAADLDVAEQLLAERPLNWWQPLAAYARAAWHAQRGEVTQACTRLRAGLQAIDGDGGCPDYAPLLWLALGLLVTDRERAACLRAVLDSAETRCWPSVRDHCRLVAGRMLAQSADSADRAAGEGALSAATAALARPAPSD